MKQKVNIGKVKKNNSNPRFIKDAKFKKLVKSIKEFPEMLEKRPIVVDENMVILGGNMRFEACKAAGLFEVWIDQVEGWSEEQKRQFIIKDNVGFGEWDWDILSADFTEEELTDWGLDIPDMAFDIDDEVEEDDYTEPDDLEVDVVLGDLIEIGNHRLLCGDSTDADQIQKLIGNEKIDLVFTDPPYGIDVVQGKSVGGSKSFGTVGGGKIVKAKEYSPIIGDDTTETAKEFYNACVSLGFENYIIWGGNYFTDFLNPSMCWIVWDKENTGNFADVELAWTSFDKAAKLYKWQWNGMIRKGDKQVEGKTRIHPTQKPVGLFGEIFKDFNFNICFDGFLGSGSTMVSAHQIGKKCFGIEMDEKYCQLIIDRMQKLDPSLEVKINGEPYKKQ